MDLADRPAAGGVEDVDVVRKYRDPNGQKI
jgi:hypothetical protein